MKTFYHKKIADDLKKRGWWSDETMEVYKFIELEEGNKFIIDEEKLIKMIDCPKCKKAGCGFCQNTGFIRLKPFCCKASGENIVDEDELIKIIGGNTE